MPGHKDNMGDIVFTSVEELTVSDVYDLACEIGKECECLIGSFGPDCVNPLIKKVIVSLELLERFATKNEQDNANFEEMRTRIEKLEAEKQQKIASRHKFEKEIETVEEQWRSESRELLKLVQRLQDENKRLTQDKKTSSSSATTTNSATAEDLENMQKVFRNEVENHKIEMKRREEEINGQQEDIVNLQLQVESLKATNVDVKRFQRELQAQIRTLVDERTNFITRIQDQHTEIVALKQATTTRTTTKVDTPAGQDTAVSESCVVKVDDDSKKCANSTTQSRSSADYDPPVQGPMPYEPDDAPWKRRSRRDSESGIRKFFRQLFLEADKAPTPFSALSSRM